MRPITTHNIAEQYLVPVATGSEAWLEKRKGAIGSSEIATLFDASPYLTRFELFHRKVGNLPDSIEDSERMFWGRELEVAIATGAAKQHGWKLYAPQGIYRHPDYPGMAATPDLFAEDAEGNLFVIEVKNIDGLIFRDQWTNEEPPLHYILQLQQQLACTGLLHGKVVVLIGGNRLGVFPYDRHAATIARLKSAVDRFWQDVTAGKEPDVCDADLDALKALYPQSRDIEIDLSGDNELPGLCAEKLEANAVRLAAEKREDAAAAAIKSKLRDAARARCNGFSILHPDIVQNMQPKGAYQKRFRKLTIKEMTI